MVNESLHFPECFLVSVLDTQGAHVGAEFGIYNVLGKVGGRREFLSLISLIFHLRVH